VRHGSTNGTINGAFGCPTRAARQTTFLAVPRDYSWCQLGQNYLNAYKHIQRG
jgi:hypothetical protein